MYRPVLVTPPVIQPISRAAAKLHCRIEDDDDNDLVDALIIAATTHLDGWTGILGRCLVEQTWRQDFDEIWDCMRMPLFPVISVTSITYRDTANAEQTIAAGNYSLQTDELGSFARFLSSYARPAVYQEKPAVSVIYKAGYAVSGAGDDQVAAVPHAIKQAMLLMIGHWYNNREAVHVGNSLATEVPMAADALLTPYRRVRF